MGVALLLSARMCMRLTRCRRQASVLSALEKNAQLLRDRPIKVINKRTNLPIWQVQPTRGRGRGGRGRGGFAPRRGYRGGYRGYGRGHYRPY